MSNFSEKKLNKINNVSSCFCLAKWLQVTIDLVNGTTHSCHHPKRHAVPLAEIKNNVSALHNTSFKKEQRKKMLAGERPSECSYCWDIEDLGNKYSDRYIKSTDPWAWPYLDAVLQQPWDADVTPKYLEVMVDNLCNFSCAYCIPDVSTGVADEIKRFGPYQINSVHRLPAEETQKEHRAVFLDAFEKWLPQITNELHVLRVTGGEPLLSRAFWKIFDGLQSALNPNLEFMVNSHFNHRQDIIQKLCDKAKQLILDKKIKSFQLYISLDTFGEQAEFIRHGLNYDRVINNIKYAISAIPHVEIVIMCTYNILSIDGFSRFLDDIIELKKLHPITLDISYLKNPGYLRAVLATDSLTSKIESDLARMKSLPEYFSAHEITKMENLLKYVTSKVDAVIINQDRGYFYLFIKEYSRRKNKDFLQIFSNYRGFYAACEKIYQFTKETVKYNIDE